MRYYRAEFLYKGIKSKIVVKAENKTDAIALARRQKNGMLVSINEIPIPLEEKFKIFFDIFISSFARKKINYSAYVAALRQLAVLLKAGISLKDSLEDIGNNTQDEIIKKLFLDAAKNIDTGRSLSSTFADYEVFVGGISVAIMRLGEQTGDIVLALENLADIFEEMDENRRKMIKALRYPIITIFAIFGAFLFLVLTVVPKFKSIFEQLHADLPLPTIILLRSQEFLAHYGIWLLFGFIFLVLIILFLYRTSVQFKYSVDEILLKTYLIKDIIKYGSIARFLGILSHLLKSGIPLIDALKISMDVIENSVLKEDIQEIIRGINRGKNFAEMIEEVGMLNFIALRMVKAGEESGNLDGMLERASEYYSDRFRDIVDNMQAAIEPIMMIVIGALVLLLALGIFMPMWNLADVSKNAG